MQSSNGAAAPRGGGHAGAVDLLADAAPAAPSGRPGFRAAEHWALTVLWNLPNAVAVVSVQPDGWRIVAVNEALTRLTGFSRASLLVTGADLAEMPGMSPEAARVLAGALADGDSGSVVVPARRADGTGYWTALEMARLPADEAPPGSEQLWVCVARDVSADVEDARLRSTRLEIERRARRSLSLVARISDVLQDVEAGDVLRTIADLLTSRVVAWSGFFTVGRTLHQIEGLDEEPPAAPRRPRAADPAEDPVLDLLQRATMRILRIDLDTPVKPGTVTADLVAEVLPRLEGLPYAARTMLVLPTLGRRDTLALLVALPHTQGRPELAADGADPGQDGLILRDDTDTVLELVARRVGMAMDNAQLYAREHRLAETLQRAMLPEQDEVAGLDVWTYYAPNAEHAQVGGDWYDVINVRDDVVAVVIGDVVGHDVEAAAAMGQLRSVVRAYAAELVDPGTVLGRVDTLLTGIRMPRPASLIYATLTPEGDVWHLAYSRAGHLPGLLARDGEVTYLDGAGGSLVGFGTGARKTAEVEVLPGDVVVLYTDGLVERRDRAMRQGMEELAALLSTVRAPDAAGVGEELLQLADAPEDDVAMVVLHVPGGPEQEPDVAAPRRRRWRLPVDPASIGRARHAVRRTCAAWGIPHAGAAELVVSELMANAVMHGWGRVGLYLHDTGDGLRIEVEDANPAPPVTRERHASRVGGFGMHIVDRLADWGWRATPNGKVVWARLRTEDGGLAGRS
ncbi:SpoIIE family protein phosphatase [Georgenia sp. TF02-10]|uniref:ATP-binding SpoIIE family protein phosphatase n=1 Tax=Georgenia sp. TF02-10 TaxID=2917725 RepID=UPI001FA6CF30|nr:SpoIIE family protein phosphatase [Georgenia sp. TF02-10]UNX54597.1 SpoIIE family protein phosphatase [Georgenia sp. TF02-10]